MPDTLVIGGGISGLTAAFHLQRAGRDVRVLEASDAAGGVIGTTHQNGFLFERGPSSWLTQSPWVDRLIDEVGLREKVLVAGGAARRRYLFRGGHLREVSPHPLHLLRSPVLSLRGRLRLLMEPLVSGTPPRPGQSFAAFMDRRIGREAREILVDAFIGGIHAGDSSNLGAEDAFPRLVDAVKEHGSLARGLRALQKASGGPPETCSLQDGLESLPRRVAARLGKSGVRYGAPARTLAPRRGGGWRVEIGGATPETLESDTLVLATPARAAASLLRSLDPEAAETLSRVEFAPIAVVGYGVDQSAFRGDPPSGFGFLVPPGESLPILGCVHSSVVFPGRAPEGGVTLSCFVGGSRDPLALELDDDALLARVYGALQSALGLEGRARETLVHRIPRGIPQYTPGHRRRMADLAERVARDTGIVLAGSHLQGISLHDSIASGYAAAEALLRTEGGS